MEKKWDEFYALLCEAEALRWEVNSTCWILFPFPTIHLFGDQNMGHCFSCRNSWACQLLQDFFELTVTTRLLLTLTFLTRPTEAACAVSPVSPECCPNLDR